MKESSTNTCDTRPELDFFGARHRFKAALGLIELGDGAEALKELQPLLGGQFHGAATEEVRLWAQSMARGPEGVCDSALVALEKGTVTDDLLQTAYLEALNTGRPMLALRFLNACTPAHAERAEALHSRACAASQLGFYEQALKDIAASLTCNPDPVSLLIDAHLAPAWHHYASIEPRLWEAKILTLPEFAQLAQTCRQETKMRTICWYTARICLPQRLIPVMTRDQTLYVSPGSHASIMERRWFINWLNERRRRMARVLRRAIQRARNVMCAMKTVHGAEGRELRAQRLT